MNQVLKQTPSLRDRIVEVLREHHEVKHIGALADRLEATIPAAEPVAWIAAHKWDQMTSAEPWLTNVVFSEDQSASFPCIPLYAAPPAPCLAVKALEWTQFTDRSLDLNADSIEGAYVIRPSAGNKFPVYLWVPGVPYDDARLKPFNDLEAAKSHAQTHHEALIRSALSAQVQEVDKPMENGLDWFIEAVLCDEPAPGVKRRRHGRLKFLPNSAPHYEGELTPAEFMNTFLDGVRGEISPLGNPADLGDGEKIGRLAGIEMRHAANEQKSRQDLDQLETHLQTLIEADLHKARMASNNEDMRLWFVAELISKASGRIPLLEIEGLVSRQLAAVEGGEA